MRIATALFGFMVLTGCSGGSSQPRLPDGWSSGTISGCCTIGVPPGATLKSAADAIDDPVMLLRGPNFEAMITLTTMGAGLPPASSGSGYKSSKRQIDGREAEIAAFTAVPSRMPLPETRYMLWKIKEPNDGTGQSLIVNFSCHDKGCGTFEPLISSLRIQR